ncbi:MAG: translation initiation factor IF-2 [Bacteroidetes bacterium]|nr:translation initiation factor IF-2 [Bacteroidota bacterium]
MSETGEIRLSKALKEFNVGIDHAIAFLATKGQKIDRNPNAKISGEAYALLLNEYASDKKAKDDSKKIDAILKPKKEVIEEKPKVVEAPVIAKKVEPAPVEVPKPIVVPKEVEPVEEKVKETPKAKTTKKAVEPEPEPEVIPAKTEEKLEGPKVLGKLDLSTINSKTKPDKKTKAQKEKEEAAAQEEKKAAKKSSRKAAEEKEEEEKNAKKSAKKTSPEPEVVAPPTPEVVAPAPAPTAVVEEKPAVPEIEHHKTNYEKLEGPTILGKIELPVKEDRKKPVASSSGFDLDKSKKKRKRIRKGGTSSTDSFDPNTGPNRPVLPANPRPQFGGNTGGGGFKKDNRERSKPFVKAELTPEEIQAQIKETLARLSGAGKSKASKHRRTKREEGTAQRLEDMEMQEAEKKVIKVTEFVSANELASMMSVPVNNIISTCMSLGIFVSINQRLNAETINIVAEEFGYTVDFVSADVQVAIEDDVDKPEELEYRSPIVTVMGHVDHGKTSLLDYIRKANVIAGEAGGITQHIGAYSVQLDNGKRIAFLDTPGHEAFTAMRARGAQVTDIVIVVVAADDNVMPQTKEAINHAQAAGVPIIIAINKIDKPGANPDKIREELSQMNILVEEWGGKYQCQEISAKKGTNIDLLLEKVLLEAEILDLKANPNKNAVGAVIESSLDKGRGYITTVLVQSGKIKVGDIVLAGCYSGRVKALFNERGVNVKDAGPSTPALLLGLSGAPTAGDKFKVMDDEREAREIATKRLQLQREQGYRTQKHITLDEIGRRLAIGDFKELNVIVKGDVDGSIEALTDSLLKLSTDKIQVNVIHKSVGQVTESDVLLASASNAIIVGFQVRPSGNARKLAEQEQIDIRLYSIIYDAINEIKSAMQGMLAPEFEEKIVCNIEIREVFNITKVGTIAGCMVLDGKVTRNTKVRIIRDGIVIHTGELGSLKRFKDDVKEVTTGYECGLNINNFNDIQPKDIIEGYEMVELKVKL